MCTISGKTLKEAIDRGLHDHAAHLNLAVTEALYNTADTLLPDINYDLFCTIAGLMIRAQGGVALVTADLMALIHGEDAELLSRNTLADMGGLFKSALTAPSALAHLNKLAGDFKDDGCS